MKENDDIGDFKSIMAKKSHPSSLTNKGLKEIIKGGTVRVSKHNTRVIFYIIILYFLQMCPRD